jgi:hypothetical protein
MTGPSHRISDPQPTEPAATTAAGGLWLRWVVLVLAGAESLLLMAYIGFLGTALWSSDALGRSIAQGVMTLAAIPLLLLALPALIMGVIDRWLPLALLLIELALPVAMLLFHYA